MVVYACDRHEVSDWKEWTTEKKNPSVAMMTNFGFGPFAKPDCIITSEAFVPIRLNKLRE